MEEQLPTSLSEGEIAEFIEHDEVEPGQVRWSAIRPWRPARLSISRLLTRSTTLKKRPRAPVADARTSYGDGQMRLSRSDSTDHNDVALIGDERATGKVADQVFVDGCTGEVEVIDIFCQR